VVNQDKGELVGVKGRNGTPLWVIPSSWRRFIMGKSDDVADIDALLKQLRSFVYMDETEITNSEYRQGRMGERFNYASSCHLG
jgi:muconolactone delta-isomerase